MSGDRTGVRARILERIHRLGPLSFAHYLEMALYDEGGFFATGGGAGRRRDFLTSPEVGPLFATVMARALDAWWEELGRPDPMVVLEAGAGEGTLAAGIRRAAPACSSALRYVLVERSPTLRARQGDHLALEPPSAVLATAGDPDEEGEAHPLAGTGPVFTSLAELPGPSVVGVVLANELLDDLPFLLLERGDGDWAEVRVGEAGGDLVEVLVPAAPQLAAEAGRLAPDAPEGGRIPLQHAARAWLQDALACLERGRVVVIDYADETASLATRPWQDWVRTYRRHGRGEHPLAVPGAQDVTCEVAVDQLSVVRAASSDRSQADFLRSHGLDGMLERARATWTEMAHRGDLPALQARSLVGEAAALTDLTGLGAFRVLEWEV